MHGNMNVKAEYVLMKIIIHSVLCTGKCTIIFLHNGINTYFELPIVNV